MKNQSIKRYLTISLSVLSLTFIAGWCDKAQDPAPKPTASFTYYPNTNLVAPVVISFTNKSANADSYQWTYGSGAPDPDKDIDLTFSKSGTYTVTLNATGKGGTDTYSRTITIANATTPPPTQPTAGFTYSPSSNLVAPATIAFTNTSTNASSYKWDFGDGTTSTTASPSKTFTSDGTYTVKLTATSTSGSAETSKNIVVAKAVSNTPTTSNIDPFRYIFFGGSGLQSKELKAFPFTLTKSTPIVVMYTSRYTSQAAILSATEYTKFINNENFQGQAVFDKQYGYQYLTLNAGTYYYGVRDVGGNKNNFYTYEAYYSTQIPAADRCEFVDIYIDNLKVLNTEEYLYHKFTIQEGFRYIFNGCYSSDALKGYFIPESELSNYTSGPNFKYYSDYVAGAAGTLAVPELKLPPGNYYFVFKNTLSNKLPIKITYFMERYRRL